MTNLGQSDEWVEERDLAERRNLEYWLAIHEKAARTYAEDGHLVAAERQWKEAARVRDLLEVPNA
jgi:hypothetical protein